LKNTNIKANDTVFLVGEILEIILPDKIVNADGYIDLEAAGTLTISSLDGYHETKLINRLSYAKTDKEIRPI
jgi:hypothetical protein